jgi:dolichol-phosphate mannosyltransferase
VLRDGWKVSYVPVNHRPRLTGASKYTNLGRMLVSVHDLLGVRWLQRRHRGRTETKEL